MVEISTSNNENVQGVCVHSMNVYFDFEYKSTHTVTTGPLGRSESKDNFTIYFYSTEKIACKPKSDDFYSNGKVGDIRSTAKNKDFKNISFSTKSQPAGPVTIRQTGEWLVERICDTCCKEFKEKQFAETQQTMTDGEAFGGTGQFPMPPEYSNGTNLQKYLNRLPYGSPGYQRVIEQHPIIFRKIMNMIKDQSNQFNKFGYLNSGNAAGNLLKALTKQSEDIDSSIINQLGCAGSVATCEPCNNHPPTQYDPTYKNENDIILELNYKNTIVTRYGPQLDSLKLVDLNFSKNDSWVNNI
jgi:hypothetical protein